MWIESHLSLARHPKALRFARSLKKDLPAIFGHLHLLWWWTLEYAPTGSLDGVSDQELANVCMYRGDPARLVASLMDAGFLNPDRSIHDWFDYTGRLLIKRASTAQRVRRHRESKEAHYNDDVTRYNGVTDALRNTSAEHDVTPYRTVPNSTQPDRTPADQTQEHSTQQHSTEPAPEPDADATVPDDAVLSPVLHHGSSIKETDDGYAGDADRAKTVQFVAKNASDDDDSPDAEPSQNGASGLSREAGDETRDKPTPVRAEPVEARDGGEGNADDVLDVPDWFLGLMALPGWNTSFDEVLDWMVFRGIGSDHAESVATGLAAKWGGPGWAFTEPWATFRNWALRPPRAATQPQRYFDSSTRTFRY
ncbi:MAG: hypothetical protein O2854_08195 [Chloroflexi bacterium]|nr:hypothetical protein [Chloroflexota bacterium]